MKTYGPYNSPTYVVLFIPWKKASLVGLNSYAGNCINGIGVDRGASAYIASVRTRGRKVALCWTRMVSER